MSELTRIKSDLMGALGGRKSDSSYDTPAEVVRIENGVAWVHIPGGVEETPVTLTVDAKEGDTVQIRVSGGAAWITGNATAPPTDDTLANVANETAIVSQETAVLAREEATAAMETAAAARSTANTAMASADGKSTIYRQADAPTGGTYKSGDTWFDTDDGNKIYSWDGTEWVPGLIGTNAIDDAAITNAKISNLDAGKITTGKLAAARIDVDDLFSQNINATGTITGVTLRGTMAWLSYLAVHARDNTASGSDYNYIEYEISCHDSGISIGAFQGFTSYGSDELVHSRGILFGSDLAIYITDENNSGIIIGEDIDVNVQNIYLNNSYLFAGDISANNIADDGWLHVAGDIEGGGNFILGDSNTTGALYTRLVTSARSVELFNYETSGNVGLYDRGNSSWILRSESNQRVYIPHNFTIGATSLNGVNMQFLSGTRNGGINLSAADNFGLFDNTNNSWIIRSSGGQASGESVGDVFIPHPLTVGGKLTAPNIVHGRVQITPTAINTPTSAAVTWPDMGGTPNIALGANTVVPGTQVKGVGFSGASSTGCTIWLTRDTNLTAVWVHYIAVY